MKWPQPKMRWSSLLWVAVTYVLAADLLPILILIVVNSSGYLPYSDRPGPGWQRPHLPSKDEVQFFLGFSFLLLRGTALYGGLFALVAGLLGFCRVPRWALGLAATPLAFVSSSIMMAAAGWMIAIAPMGVYTAAICGGLWGLLVFPRLVAQDSYTLSVAIRIVAPLLIFAVTGYWLIRPLLPNRSLTNGKVEVIRIGASGQEPLSLDYLGQEFAGRLAQTKTYSSVSRLEFKSDGKNQVRALLIIDDPQLVAHTFVLPRTGMVVYRQSHGVWKEEESGEKISDISVTLSAFNSLLEMHGPCCSYVSSGLAPYR